MTDSATIPVTEEWLEGTGGRIFIRHWEPVGASKANLVICHGVNSHGGQYVRAGKTFAGRGFAVTAFDLRGRGKSDGERYYAESCSTVWASRKQQGWSVLLRHFRAR